MKKRANNEGLPAANDHAAFAARLRDLVDSVGSARAFAAQADVSEGAVGTWLSRVEPTREKLAAIANATGVSLDWLITGRGPRTSDYIAMRFADLSKSKGIATRPFWSTDNRIFLPVSVIGITESERETIDPMALLLPPETSTIDEADFVVFDLTKEGASPPSPPTLCVILDEGRVRVRPARSSTGLADMFGPILGPVIFRGAIIDRKKPKRGEKPK
jgi:transcriptional regulator with XRE-family HTH domain